MKTVVRLVAGVLAALVVTLVSLSTALACNCAELTRAEQVQNADVVARVIVERTKTGKDADGVGLVTFSLRPTHVWKGDIVSIFDMTSALDSASCGLGAIAEGTDVMLFASQDGQGISANSCGGTSKVSDAVIDEVVAIAGPGEAVDTTPGDEPGAWIWPSVTGLVAVVLIGGVVVYWWVLPRHRR